MSDDVLKLAREHTAKQLAAAKASSDRRHRNNKLSALSLTTLRRMLRQAIALAGQDCGTARVLRRAIDQKCEQQRTRAKWPIESDSVACHPEQVAERNQFIKGHGLAGVHCRPDGTMVFSGPRTRQKYLNKIGLIDRSGYT